LLRSANMLGKHAPFSTRSSLLVIKLSSRMYVYIQSPVVSVVIPVDVVIPAPVTVFFHAIPRSICFRTALPVPRNFAIDSRPVMLKAPMAFVIRP